MNFEEAMAKVKEEISDDCVITQIVTRPYGWIFDFTSRLYIETGDPRHSFVDKPWFVSKLGELQQIPNMFAGATFLKNWEVEHPAYPFPDFYTVAPLNDWEQGRITSFVNLVLLHILKDKAEQVRFDIRSDLAQSNLHFLVDGIWKEHTSSGYLALIARRLKEMADIEPREKNLTGVQTGTIDLTQRDKKYLVTVTSTIVQYGEQLDLLIQPQP